MVSLTTHWTRRSSALATHHACHIKLTPTNVSANVRKRPIWPLFICCHLSPSHVVSSKNAVELNHVCGIMHHLARTSFATFARLLQSVALLSLGELGRIDGLDSSDV
jgi:hypothetical protein